ncbi:uncharacterized protein LOC143038971 isoform X1 [Oratosquilla oratoria]|uniref:uncharacterized protein LOC143038971 isoform X1 n=1 Tax=Oratosquilla oratoria TaxID=337810 RepID=UPI003F771276
MYDSTTMATYPIDVTSLGAHVFRRFPLRRRRGPVDQLPVDRNSSSTQEAVSTLYHCSDDTRRKQRSPQVTSDQSFFVTPDLDRVTDLWAILGLRFFGCIS